MYFDNFLRSSFVVIFLSSALSGCTTTPKPASTRWAIKDTCTLPNHKQLQVAINKTQAELSKRSCHYQFEDMHQQLLDIAKNDPDHNNGKKLLLFYKWSVNQGVISSRQGKEFYNRYFKATFGNVLPNDRNVCSIASIKDKLIIDLGHELQNKKIGLQLIMQNRDEFFEAQRIHNELVFLIETTLMACNKA